MDKSNSQQFPIVNLWGIQLGIPLIWGEFDEDENDLGRIWPIKKNDLGEYGQRMFDLLTLHIFSSILPFPFFPWPIVM
jgi:hypothetical protein